MTDNKSSNTAMAVIANDISYMKEYLKAIDTKISNEYATKQAVEIARSGLLAQIELLKDKVRTLNRFMYGTIGVSMLAIFYAIATTIGLGDK